MSASVGRYGNSDEIPPGLFPYTVEDAIESMKLGPFQVRLLIVAGLIYAVEEIILAQLPVIFPSLECEWRLSSTEVASLTTALYAGIVCGALFSGKIADNFGRKPVMFLRTALAAYFTFLCAFTPNHWSMIVAQFIIGVALAGTTQIFVLLTEYIGSRYRIGVIIVKQVAAAIFMALTTLLAWAVIPPLGWRYFLAFTAIPIGLALLLWPWLPESCRFLLISGQREKATKALTSMVQSNNSTPLPGELQGSYEERRGRLLDLCRGGYLRSTVQISLLWLIVGFCYNGISILNTELLSAEYCATESGGTTQPPDACGCTVLTSTHYLRITVTYLSELIAMPLVAVLAVFLGRRLVTGICGVLTGTCWLLLLSCMGGSWGVTALMFVLRGFTGSATATLYLYISEVYPTHTRGLGFAVAYFSNRLGATITPFAAQVLVKVSVNWTLILYGMLSFLSALMAFLLPIETKGRRLE